MRLQSLASKAIKRGHEELRFLRWEINKKFRKSVTVQTRQGSFNVLFADNAISKELYCYGQYELDLMSNAMAFLRSIRKCPPKGEGTIVDIGANIGVISIGMLHTGQLKQAIAIEPDPQNFSSLQGNVILNGLDDRVLCLPIAASHQTGEILFELSDTNYGDHRVWTNSFRSLNSESPELFHESGRRTITVQSDQLDNLLAGSPESFTRNIALVWVDVQGYDGYVYMGAKTLLTTGIPVVSEIWPYGIRRTGMTQEEYCAIASSIWSNYWVWRREKFVRYPLNTLDIFFNELGYDGAYDNVIFTQ
jgi:FkbM family methyltransferase